jgi:hypothetical protein
MRNIDSVQKQPQTKDETKHKKKRQKKQETTPSERTENTYLNNILRNEKLLQVLSTVKSEYDYLISNRINDDVPVLPVNTTPSTVSRLLEVEIQQQGNHKARGMEVLQYNATVTVHGEIEKNLKENTNENIPALPITRYKI